MLSSRTTTSEPISTRRLARSMASSAIVVWSSAGRLYVRVFLGMFVDEDEHEVRFGVVLGDRVRDLLHDRGLTGLRGRDDETALALADGRDEVDQTRRVQLRGGLQPQALLRVER